ncbi:hypothetical protein Tco_1123656 [Tanacetum coccineum]|uniref:Reverse transcriptase domain-containing protein n=1 Tax=Tanacetum coccineum TaxID=301880 RepID=A0ABQ5J3Y8_9ASTR
MNLSQLVQANSFYGRESENPHAHINSFKRITSTLRFRNVSNDVIKLMMFPYSLEGAAKTCDRQDKSLIKSYAMTNLAAEKNSNSTATEFVSLKALGGRRMQPSDSLVTEKRRLSDRLSVANRMGGRRPQVVGCGVGGAWLRGGWVLREEVGVWWWGEEGVVGDVVLVERYWCGVVGDVGEVNIVMG